MLSRIYHTFLHEIDLIMLYKGRIWSNLIFVYCRSVFSESMVRERALKNIDFKGQRRAQLIHAKKGLWRTAKSKNWTIHQTNGTHRKMVKLRANFLMANF